MISITKLRIRMIKKGAVVTFALFFSALILNPAVGYEKEIRIVGGKDPESPSSIYLNKLYSEAFKRIGYKFIYEEMPNKRASIESDKGEDVAGELSRVSNYNTVHPDMIRLDIPHYSVKFIAISAKYPKLELNGWKSLKGKDLKIACRRGTKIAEEQLPRYVANEDLSPITSTEQGLRLVLMERVDIFIEGSVNVAKYFEKNEIKKSKIYFPGVMEEIEIFMFIHKNYRDLVPGLNVVMKDMYEEGLFDKYRDEASFTALEMR